MTKKYRIFYTSNFDRYFVTYGMRTNKYGSSELTKNLGLTRSILFASLLTLDKAESIVSRLKSVGYTDAKLIEAEDEAA